MIQTLKLTLAKKYKTPRKHLSEDKFLDALRSLKINKALCFHEIDVHVINQLYNDIKKPLIRIFDDLIKLKSSKVTPIFKSGKKELLTKLQTNISFAVFFKDTRENYVSKTL